MLCSTKTIIHAHGHYITCLDMNNYGRLMWASPEKALTSLPGGFATVAQTIEAG